MKFKKAVSGILCTAMICTFLPVMPQAGQAATVGSIEPIKPGDNRVQVNFTEAKKGEAYEIYVNGVRDQAGVLDSSQNIYKTMYFLLNNPVKAGDKVEFRVQDKNGAIVPAPAVTVGGAAAPTLPMAMVPSATSVAASDNASVKLTFNDGYTPHENDKIRVMAYDSKDKLIGTYDVDMPDAYNAPVSIQLKDSAKTAYYTLGFLAGSGQTTGLQPIKITVTAGAGGEEGGMTDDQQAILNQAVDMIFMYPSTSVSLGESVTPTIKLVDKTGKATPYTGPMIFSYSGEAIVEGSFDSKGRFTVNSSQAYEGSKIQVTAMVGSFSKTVELIVQASDKSLLLTPATAGIGAAREVGFQLANGSGDRLRLLWQPTVAQVVMKAPDGVKAKMTGTVTDLSTITTTGDGKLLLSCDTPLDADVYIVFRDNEGHFYETAISKFKFTQEGANAVSVTLYINSYNYSINGVYKTTYTKPVIKDNRTFVPFRLIAELLGNCQVDFDNDTRTVIATDGTITVHMPIGSKEYTVNGVKKTMDVAPYINSDNRTMVPFRVLGEIFGCTVAHQAGANGATVSVTMERK